MEMGQVKGGSRVKELREAFLYLPTVNLTPSGFPKTHLFLQELGLKFTKVRDTKRLYFPML